MTIAHAYDGLCMNYACLSWDLTHISMISFARDYHIIPNKPHQHKPLLVQIYIKKSEVAMLCDIC